MERVTKVLVLACLAVIFPGVAAFQNDDIGHLKELIIKQQDYFEQKLHKLQQNFDEKLQEKEKSFEQKFNEQQEQLNRLRQHIIKDELKKSFADKEKNQLTLDNNSKKRSDDTDPIIPVLDQLSQRVDGITADVQTMKNEHQNLRNAVVKATDSLYVHWGSSTCTNTSQLVYSGVIGGSFYSPSGSGTNPLCLPMTPAHINHPSDTAGYAALHGAEYETLPFHSHNFDAQCSVCRSFKTTTLMIPATNTCYPDWTLEYSGYLMAGRPEAGRTGNEYICVDSKLEGRAGTLSNQDGLLLYLTQAHCGSLPCPPYKEGEVIVCVVCSK